MPMEEAIKKGGFGEMLEVFAQENKFDCKIKVMAIEDQFVEHGSVGELRTKLKLDGKSIYNTIIEELK